MYEGRIGQVADKRKIRRLFTVGSFSQSTPCSIQSMWAAAKKKSDTKIRTGHYEQEQHRVIFHSHKIPNEYEYWRTQKFNLKQRNRFRSTAILAFTKCNVVMNSVSWWNWQHTFIIVEKAKTTKKEEDEHQIAKGKMNPISGWLNWMDVHWLPKKVGHGKERLLLCIHTVTQPCTLFHFCR